MNWTDGHRRVDKGVTVGKCRMDCLLFADELVAYCMRGSSQQRLELAFDWFSAACDQEGTKISSEKIKVLCLLRRPSRPVISLGRQGGEEFSESGANFLNYVQHIFPGEAKIFLGLRPPPFTGLRPRQCFLQVSGNTLQQVETFKYLGVAFTSDESRNKRIDTRICKANAVLRELYCSVVTKREFSKHAKLSVSKSVFVPILAYGH